jgi:hypothetical protein
MNWKKESVDEKQDFPRSADKFLKKAERKIEYPLRTKVGRIPYLH